MSIEIPDTNEWDVVLAQFTQFRGAIPIEKLQALARIAFWNYQEKLEESHIISVKLKFLIALGEIEKNNDKQSAIKSNLFTDIKQSMLSKWIQRRREDKINSNVSPELQPNPSIQ